MLVVDALRQRPHPTHFSVERGAGGGRTRIGAVARRGSRTSPTICRHAATCARLPEGVELAYDGLTRRVCPLRAGRRRPAHARVDVIHFPDDPRPPRWTHPVLALGNFDGLHRGHVEDHRAREPPRAASGAATSVVMTFDPHPPRVVRPDKAPPLLMTKAQRLEAIAARRHPRRRPSCGSRPSCRSWDPETFVRTVLVEWLHVAEVWVGANFLFGRDRAGNFSLLRALGARYGFRAEKIDPVRYKEFVVSSTRIRRLISEGRVDEAGALLGHPYAIDGTVVEGARRGREIGFPTANLQTDNELVPPHGVYATTVSWTVGDPPRRSPTSACGRRSASATAPTIETHLLGVRRGPLRRAHAPRLRPAAAGRARVRRRRRSCAPRSSADVQRRASSVRTHVAVGSAELMALDTFVFTIALPADDDCCRSSARSRAHDALSRPVRDDARGPRMPRRSRSPEAADGRDIELRSARYRARCMSTSAACRARLAAGGDATSDAPCDDRRSDVAASGRRRRRRRRSRSGCRSPEAPRPTIVESTSAGIEPARVTRRRARSRRIDVHAPLQHAHPPGRRLRPVDATTPCACTRAASPCTPAATSATSARSCASTCCAGRCKYLVRLRRCTRSMNFTDVDDQTIAGAQKAGHAAARVHRPVHRRVPRGRRGARARAGRGEAARDRRGEPAGDGRA